MLAHLKNLFNNFLFPYLKSKIVRRLPFQLDSTFRWSCKDSWGFFLGWIQSCNSVLNSRYSVSQCNFEHMLWCLWHRWLREVPEHPHSGSLCCTPRGTLRRICSTKDYNFSALRFSLSQRRRIRILTPNHDYIPSTGLITKTLHYKFIVH